MTTQKISVQDALWLSMDRPNNLMVIDGVLWFLEQPDWDAVRGVVEERLVKRFPVFSSKAVKGDDGLSWVSDPDFDISNHLLRADLPSPCTLTEAQEFVGAQRSRPLSKDKPLWEFHIIDNVVRDDGVTGAIVMVRFHHAIADGVRLVQVIFGLCDPIEGDMGVAASVGGGRGLDASTKSGASGPLDAVVGVATGLGGQAVSAGLGAVSSVRSTAEFALGAGTSAAAGLVGRTVGAATDPVGTAKALPGAIAGMPGHVSSAVGHGQAMFDDALGIIGDPGQLVDAFTALAPVPDEVPNTAASVAKLAFSMPSVKTSWSGTPGTAKSVHWVDAMQLDRVKEVGRGTGATVNDVLLSVVAGTLRDYLAEHGESVSEVMWMIPVSLKPFDPGMPEELGNHFALVALKMPLDIADPKERLAEINRRINKIKKSHEAVITFGVQRAIATSPEQIGVFLTNFFANKAVGVLTNVPGPRGPIALAGTPVEGVLGWAPTSGDCPMTITIFSYNGRVHVGFGVDQDLIPDGHRLPLLFADNAHELYTAVTGKDAKSDATPILP